MANTFTVKASAPVTVDTVVKFQLVEGTAVMADFPEGSFNEKTVTILAGQTESTEKFTVTGKADDLTESSETYTVQATAGTTVLTPVQVTLLDGSAGAISGQTFTLTANPDTIPGGLKGSANTTSNSGDDTIIGSINAPAGGTDISTFTALDGLDGGTGIDTLKISAITDFAAPGGATVTGVETVSIGAAAKLGAYTDNTDAALDLSTLFAGATALALSGSTEADVKGPSTAAITFTNPTGKVELYGGISQTMTIANQGGKVELLGTTGAVTVTSAKQATYDIVVGNGTTVNVTGSVDATTDAVLGGDILVGATGVEPTGAVTIVQNLTSNGGNSDDDDLTATAITVVGGTTVNATVNATSTAKDETSSGDIAVDTVTVTGGTSTTAVTVKQNATATTFTKAATALVAATDVVTFFAIKNGEDVVVGGLKFTANKDLTAEQVAAAFSNLTLSDKQTLTGPVANGYFTDASTYSGTSGAASGTSVTFTGAAHNTTLTITSVDTDADGTGADIDTDPTTVHKDGTEAVTATTSANTVARGAVVIDGAKITTISIDGYGASSTIGTNTAAAALTTLSLANSEGAITVDTTAALTLALTVNKVMNDVSIDAGTATTTTLNMTATGADSTFKLTAAAVKDLTVAGDKVLTLNGSSVTTALETVKVTGTAGLNLASIMVNPTKSIDTTGTTGAVTATISGDAATYAGGAGVDSLTLSADAVSKSIDLGAGNDSLTFNAASTTVPSVEVKGGTGDLDTVVMGVASAVSFGGATAFATKVTGFERLTLNTVAGTDDVNVDTVTVNMANLAYTYVTTAGTFDDSDNADVTVRDILVLDNIASDSTVVLTKQGKVTVNVKDAATNTADVLNVGVQTNETSGAPVDGTDNGSADLGTLTVANVQTVKLAVTDSTSDDDGDGVAAETNEVDAGVLILAADSAATVTVAGNTGFTLDLSGAVSTTLVDASTLVGGLTLVADGATASTEVRGGTGKDVLTSSGENDVLKGNDGVDTFNVTNLAKVYGGAGADVFNFSAALNLAKVSTVMDGVATGDTFKLFDDADGGDAASYFYAAGAQFNANIATSVELRVAASLEQTAEGQATWFNYGSFTYIVIDGTNSNDTTFGNAYEEGKDTVIEIAGVYNLSTGASFNSTSGTLEII